DQPRHDPFAQQRVRYEHGLVVDSRDAAAIVAEVENLQFDRLFGQSRFACHAAFFLQCSFPSSREGEGGAQRRIMGHGSCDVRGAADTRDPDAPGARSHRTCGISAKSAPHPPAAPSRRLYGKKGTASKLEPLPRTRTTDAALIRAAAPTCAARRPR